MPMQTAGIEIAPETIGHLMGGANLRVPLSQRSYRWEAEHVEDLYKDIHGVIVEHGAEEYFIGSIVGIKSGTTTFIYDGQQRLATTMILVAAIRDYFFSHGESETARLIEEESLISKTRRTHEVNAHFRLNAEDHSFFHARVLLRPDDKERKKVKPLRESHKRIEKATKIARDFVEESIVKNLPTGKTSDNLHRWLDFIRDGLRVIWVQVADERTAFTIFETMNDRGLKLSAADLLKNHLYATGDDRRDEVIQKWQSMAAILETIEGEEENLVEYVRCFWITRNGHTRTKDLYDKIKLATTNKTKAVALAADLESTAQDYAAILLASHDKWASRGASLRAKIEVLRSLGVTQLRPLLLAALSKFSDKQFEQLLDACVSWSVRSLLAGVPSGTLEGYYSRNAHEIARGKIRKASQVKSDLIKVIPDDNRFKLAVSTAHVANTALARYYLRALQRKADGEKEPQYVPNPGSEITLEHIIPQKPGEGWEHLTADEVKANTNRLGNLALLTGTVNSKIGNVSYRDKKPALAASGYSLTREAGSFSCWGVAEVTKRQERLADLAVKTWSLG